MFSKFLNIMLAALCLLLLAACESVSNEELLDITPGMPSDITLEQLIEKMQKATDPEKVYRNAKSYALIQDVESVDGKTRTNYSTEVLFKAPGFIRQTSKKNGKPMTTIIYRMGEAWYINPKNQKAVQVTGKDLNLIRAFTRMLNPGMTVKDIFQSIDLDICVRDNTRYYRMVCRLDDPEIAPYVFYVDMQTCLTRRLETVIYYGGDDSSLYVAISEDYRWYDKVRMPARSLITANDKTDISKIISFQLNPEISNSVFELPKKH